MASRLKLKRKKFHEPYKDVQNIDGCQSIKTPRNETVLLKRQKIFERAIANAAKHQIRLKPGTENRGFGNCSYESVILNINERDCYEEKLRMTPDYYRRIWNTDLMNKILDERIPWNPGLTRAQIQEGFKELMESGVYERNFFGDMMMAGIACGVKKKILIFNTHEMTPHDPVSVIDPRQYGGICDNEIPVVLAYDIVHYESLQPIDVNDIEETIKLTKSYTAQPSRYRLEYGFTRNDMKYLVSQDVDHHNQETPGPKDLGINLTSENLMTQKSNKIYNAKLRNSNDSKKDPCIDNNEEQETSSSNHDRISSVSKKLEEKEYVGNKTSYMRSFRFLSLEFPEMESGKMKFAFCQVESQRLVSHLNNSSKCTQYINMQIFKIEFSKYRHNQRQKKHLEM